MKERLSIDRFNGIDHLENELSTINILTGNNAVAKRDYARALYFFKQFTDEMMTCIVKELTIEEFDQYLINGFKNLFITDSFDETDFTLKYERDGHFIALSKTALDEQPKLEYAEKFQLLYSRGQELFREKMKSYPTRTDLYMTEIQQVFEKEFSEVLENELSAGWINHQIFIPADRVLYANVPRSMLNLLWQDKNMDPILTAFGEIYEKFKLFHQYMSKKGAGAKRHPVDMREILGGSYIREQESDFILRNDKKMNVKRALSADKALLPMLVVLCNLPAHQYGQEGKTIYIEEPEVHLSPQKQIEVVKLIVKLLQIRPDLQFVITTNSTTVLNTFNELIPMDQIEKDKVTGIVIMELF